MNYPFPFVVADYKKMKDTWKEVKLAIKIVDNDGDPGWCRCSGTSKMCYCKGKQHKILVLEYKRRVMIHIYDVLRKKSSSQIRAYMKRYTKKTFPNVKSKAKLIRAILIYFHKKRWQELKRILEGIRRSNKSRKVKERTKRKTRKRN